MAEKPVKIFRRSEVEASKGSESTQIIIHNNVYDVREFLNEHPGGEEVLLEQAGKDGTEAFEDVGHSKDARALMNRYKIGQLHEDDQVKTSVNVMKDWTEKKSNDNSSWKSWTIPVILAVAATIIYRFYFHYH